MSDESNDPKDAIVIKDEDIELILIKGPNISTREAISKAIEKLREA